MGDERVPSAAADSLTRGLLVPGAAGGLAAGLLMGVFVCAAAAAGGQGLTAPLEGIGAAFGGAEASVGGAGRAALGLVLHLAFSAVLGVLFLAMIPRDFPVGSAATVGVGYALVVMAIMTSSVLPEVNPFLRNRMPASGGAWVIAHALFGAALVLGPMIRRRLSGSAPAIRRGTLAPRMPAHAR